jgi:hypothetical protein
MAPPCFRPHHIWASAQTAESASQGQFQHGAQGLHPLLPDPFGKGVVLSQDQGEPLDPGLGLDCAAT